MNEGEAKKVLLIRAIEAVDADGKLLSQEDRAYAGRTAVELTRWQAAEQREPPVAAAFVVKRADLLTAKLAERYPKALHAFESLRWRPWIGVLLPLLAFVFGAVVEQIADRDHINILAFPLLGLLIWNFAVYLLLMASTAHAMVTRSSRRPGWIQRHLSGLRGSITPRTAGPLAGAFAHFIPDWTQRSSPLLMVRAARVLHLSAALLALGIIIGLYVRGLIFEYRAGWDSTFLDAGTVHAILAFFLQPAAQLLGTPFHSVSEIAAIRWNAGSGESASRWIHLYTVTAALWVVVPRLILAAMAGWRERRMSGNFHLPLDEPYFRRVLSAWREVSARVRVAPYAYTLNGAASEGVQRIAAQLFGDSVKIQFDRSVAYGEEDVVSVENTGTDLEVDLVLALFTLAATPESENHGAFLENLKMQAHGPLMVLVDELPYRLRLGDQPGRDARLEERRLAWRGMLGTRGLTATFVDLAAPDLDAIERVFEMQLSRRSMP